jgi:hypothetical protein
VRSRARGEPRGRIPVRGVGALECLQPRQPVTAAGVAAGIDMALALTAEIAGEEVAKAIQLGIEYDPNPPFDSGSPEKATPELVELIRRFEGVEASDSEPSAA